MESRELTHINVQGRARMVDVSQKPKTHRTARAAAKICMNPQTLELVKTGGMKKGDVLSVAQVAAIQAAKHTWELIPMCHPLALTHLDVQFEFLDDGIGIIAQSACTGETGVEMEALVAASTAALTIYDMCKAVQRDMVIEHAHILEKDGGASGHFVFTGEKCFTDEKHSETGTTSSSVKGATVSQEHMIDTAPHASAAKKPIGRVVSVSISQKKGTRKHTIPKLQLIKGWGCKDDAHAGVWHRQVSLLPVESLNLMKSHIPSLQPGDFAENIMTEGIALKELPVGSVFEIGDTELVLTQIGKECHTDCEIRQLTGSCVMPTDGIFCVVTRSGSIQAGDIIYERVSD